MTQIIQIIFCLMSFTPSSAQQHDPIEGHWYYEKEQLLMEIQPNEEGKYIGTIVWAADSQKTDRHGQAVLGMQVLQGLRRKVAGHYEDGRFYAPPLGRELEADAELIYGNSTEPDVLALQVSMGFISRKINWERR